MNSSQTIHETVIRDIIDIMSDLKDHDEVQFILGKNKSFKSLTSATDNLTLVFPVVCTSALSIESASMISKAIERKCCAMLQMLFSAISVDNAKDSFDYLKKFHTNIKLDGDISIDSFIDTMDKLSLELESAGLATVDHEAIKAIKEDMKNISFYLPDNISNNSINNFRKTRTVYGESSVVLQEALSPDTIAKNQAAIDNHRARVNKSTPNSTLPIDADTASKITKAASNYEIAKNTKTNINIKQSDPSEIRKNEFEMFNKQMLPTEIKKANELMPSLMIVNFVMTGTGNENTSVSTVIGVKAKLYVVDSMDLMNRIKLKYNDSNWMMKLIKASTREISFWKDFVFAIDKAKLDALSNSKRGSSSKLWKVLERRALKSKIRRNIRMENDASAISVLVISQEEVEYLKKNDNIDISNVSTIRNVMESLNLMGACIVDESMEIAKFIFDTGDDLFESLSFSHLEREASDSTYKKVVNLMGKIK